MCAQCFEAVTTLFPDIPKNEIGNFLMNCTAFPMGSEELIAQQLQELRKKTSNYKACYGIVEAEMDAITESYRAENTDE